MPPACKPSSERDATFEIKVRRPLPTLSRMCAYLDHCCPCLCRLVYNSNPAFRPPFGFASSFGPIVYLPSLVAVTYSDELGIIFSVPPPAPAPAPAPAAAPAPAEPTSADGEPPPSRPSTTAAAAAAATTSAAATSAAAAEPQFILQEHKLGVSVHSIHPLINEARAAFPAARREYRRLKEESCRSEAFPQGRRDNSSGRRLGLGLEDGEDGRTTTKQSNMTSTAEVAAAAAAAAAERLLSVTRALLLVNADHGSAWNSRKEIVVDGLCDGGSIPQEIKASQWLRFFVGLLFICVDVVEAGLPCSRLVACFPRTCVHAFAQ